MISTPRNGGAAPPDWNVERAKGGSMLLRFVLDRARRQERPVVSPKDLQTFSFDREVSRQWIGYNMILAVFAIKDRVAAVKALLQASSDSGRLRQSLIQHTQEFDRVSKHLSRLAKSLRTIDMTENELLAMETLDRAFDKLKQIMARAESAAVDQEAFWREATKLDRTADAPSRTLSGDLVDDTDIEWWSHDRENVSEDDLDDLVPDAPVQGEDVFHVDVQPPQPRQGERVLNLDGPRRFGPRYGERRVPDVDRNEKPLERIDEGVHFSHQKSFNGGGDRRAMWSYLALATVTVIVSVSGGMLPP